MTPRRSPSTAMTATVPTLRSLSRPSASWSTTSRRRSACWPTPTMPDKSNTALRHYSYTIFDPGLDDETGNPSCGSGLISNATNGTSGGGSNCAFPGWPCVNDRFGLRDRLGRRYGQLHQPVGDGEECRTVDRHLRRGQRQRGLDLQPDPRRDHRPRVRPGSPAGASTGATATPTRMAPVVLQRMSRRRGPNGRRPTVDLLTA